MNNKLVENIVMTAFLRGKISYYETHLSSWFFLERWLAKRLINKEENKIRELRKEVILK